MSTGLTKAQMAAIHVLELKQNANRAHAVTWACDVQRALQGLLQTAMINDPEVSSLFANCDGPLSSFAAQVKLAWATGVIDSELRRDLDYVRKIRNRFAYESEAKSFSTSPVRGWFQQLSPVKNARVMVKDFSRSEYHKVIVEIQLTLMALMWQKLNSEDNVEQIRATLREMIDHTVAAVVPPRSGNEGDPMDSVIAKCNASLADKPMLASIYHPDWRRDKAKELHEPGKRCYLPFGYLRLHGQWRLEEGASILLPKLNTRDWGHIVKRMQGVGSTSAEEELLLARGFALEFGRGAINVPQTPSDEIRPEFEVDAAGHRILVEAKGRVDTQFAARRRYAEDILGTTFPPSAALDDGIDCWLKGTVKNTLAKKSIARNVGFILAISVYTLADPLKMIHSVRASAMDPATDLATRDLREDQWALAIALVWGGDILGIWFNATVRDRLCIDTTTQERVRAAVRNSFYPQRNQVFFHEAMTDDEHKSAISTMFGGAR